MHKYLNFLLNLPILIISYIFLTIFLTIPLSLLGLYSLNVFFVSGALFVLAFAAIPVFKKKDKKQTILNFLESLPIPLFVFSSFSLFMLLYGYSVSESFYIAQSLVFSIFLALLLSNNKKAVLSFLTPLKVTIWVTLSLFLLIYLQFLYPLSQLNEPKTFEEMIANQTFSTCSGSPFATGWVYLTALFVMVHLFLPSVGLRKRMQAEGFNSGKFYETLSIQSLRYGVIVILSGSFGCLINLNGCDSPSLVQILKLIALVCLGLALPMCTALFFKNGEKNYKVILFVNILYKISLVVFIVGLLFLVFESNIFEQSSGLREVELIQ